MLIPVRVLLVGTSLAVTVVAGLGTPLTAAGGLNACPASNPPNTLVLVAGGTQTAQLGKAFQTNLHVALANSNGCPLTGSLAGISVDFVAPASGASGAFASNASSTAVVGTDAGGAAAAPPFFANSVPGAYSVEARSDYGTVRLSLTNTAQGLAKTVASAGQSAQSATVLGRYAKPLQATVLDADGRPVSGASVSFSLGSGAYGAGAGFAGGGAQATGLTDSSGVATSPPFSANGVSGPFTATASAEGIAEPIAYSLRNVAAKTTLATAQTTGTATVASAYRRPLRASVLDAEGRAVEGASVTFTLGLNATGAGASFVGGGAQATVRTDAAGVAESLTLRANGTAGRFTATATIEGVTRPATFSLRNLAGRPATIAAGVAASESTPVGSRFPIRLAVTVRDASGNPVGGVQVTFAAPARGPSGRFGSRGVRTARVTTNAAGVAVAPAFTAGRSPGGYVVTAGVRGARRAAFALVNERR